MFVHWLREQSHVVNTRITQVLMHFVMTGQRLEQQQRQADAIRAALKLEKVAKAGVRQSGPWG